MYMKFLFSLHLTVGTACSAVSPSTPSFLLCEFVIWADAHPHPCSVEEILNRAPPLLLYNLERRGTEGEQEVGRGRERRGG